MLLWLTMKVSKGLTSNKIRRKTSHAIITLKKTSSHSCGRYLLQRIHLELLDRRLILLLWKLNSKLSIQDDWVLFFLQNIGWTKSSSKLSNQVLSATIFLFLYFAQKSAGYTVPSPPLKRFVEKMENYISMFRTTLKENLLSWVFLSVKPSLWLKLGGRYWRNFRSA